MEVSFTVALLAGTAAANQWFHYAKELFHQRRGRPRLLWEDNFVRVFGSDWTSKHRADWQQCFGHFKDKLFHQFRVRRPPKTNISLPSPRLPKLPRNVEPLTLKWESADSTVFRVVFASDSLLVANWLSAQWMPRFDAYSEVVNQIHARLAANLYSDYERAVIRPASSVTDFWMHQFLQSTLISN